MVAVSHEQRHFSLLDPNDDAIQLSPVFLLWTAVPVGAIGDHFALLVIVVDDDAGIPCCDSIVFLVYLVVVVACCDVFFLIPPNGRQ